MSSTEFICQNTATSSVNNLMPVAVASDRPLMKHREATVQGPFPGICQIAHGYSQKPDQSTLRQVFDPDYDGSSDTIVPELSRHWCGTFQKSY